MADQDYVDVPVLAFDIERSSRHPGTDQAAEHRVLRDLVAGAFREIGLSVADGDVADRGDGDTVVVRVPFPLERLVADLPRELAARLDHLNRARREDGRLRVRLAVHRGPVWGGAGRWDGHVVVDVRRLLDAEATRTMLALHPGAALVVVVSQPVFDATVRERLRYLDPDDWTPVAVGSGEKGSGLTGGIRLCGRGAPGGRVPPAALETAPAAEGARVARHTSGPVSQGDYSPAVGTVHGDVSGRRG